MRRQGFSLVELSVVMLIIALVIGGILAGKSMAQASRLQSVIVDFSYYSDAVANFQKSYSGLPGDLPNAVTYWGAAGGAGGDNYTTSCYGSLSTGTATCNGGGNGRIGNGVGATNEESFRAWQHLANATLITGKYTGLAGTAPGTQFPGSAMNGGYSLVYLGPLTGDANYYDCDGTTGCTYGNSLLLGAPVASDYTRGPLLVPSDAEEIDRKMDDGRPAAGNLRATRPAATITPNCTVVVVALDPSQDAYKLSETQPRCTLVYRTGL